MLLDFLLNADLTNISVQALIWDALLASTGFLQAGKIEARYCDFSNDFLDPLVAAGLPLSNAYRAYSSLHFWTPYLNAGYSEAPPGYKVYLEAKGITEELSNAVREAPKVNPPQNDI